MMRTKEFFADVAAEDVDLFLGKSTDDLKRDVDAPVLQAWMERFNEKLGAFQSTSGFNYGVNHTDGVTTTKISGTATFAQGEADVELVYYDNKLAGFTVKAPSLEGDWFTGPKDTTLYQERTQTFLTEFANGRTTEAYEMMHEALQKEVTDESLAKMTKSVGGEMGELKEIQIVGDEFSNDDGQVLTVNARVVGAKNTMDGTVDFRFIGLKGHLIGFNVSPSAKTLIAVEIT